MKKGFIVPARDSRQLGANGFFAAGKGAHGVDGFLDDQLVSRQREI